MIACGSDMTDHAEKYLEHGADYVLTGEGDETLPELINHLEGKSVSALSAIQGIAYRDDNEQVVKTLPRPVINRLDELPFPAWDLVDRDKYRAIWYEHHGYYSMNLVTTRGCPFHCNWCAKPIWGQRYNVRSPQNVVEEMRWLQETFNPDQIWFMDDIMGIQDRWIEEFADLLDANTTSISPSRASIALTCCCVAKPFRRWHEQARKSSGSAQKAVRRRFSTRWIKARRSTKFTRRPSSYTHTASKWRSSCNSATPAKPVKTSNSHSKWYAT